jgi:hypothetical protein
MGDGAHPITDNAKVDVRPKVAQSVWLSDNA